MMGRMSGRGVVWLQSKYYRDRDRHFPIPIPDGFANGLTIAQEFFPAGVADFSDAGTALSIGDYGDAAYDELLGLNVTSLVPVEEIFLGSLVQIAK
jgi:hypothetical protein